MNRNFEYLQNIFFIIFLSYIDTFQTIKKLYIYFKLEIQILINNRYIAEKFFDINIIWTEDISIKKTFLDFFICIFAHLDILYKY